MTSLQTIRSANQLLEQDITFVQTWLEGVQKGQLEAPEDFNWHGLAEVAASVACSAVERGEQMTALEWAEVAVSVYEKLAQKIGIPGNESFLNSAMVLRTKMIKYLGSTVGHPVLDIQTVFNWVLGDLSYLKVKKQAEIWSERQSQDRDYILNHLDEIRQLRRIKTRLNRLAFLYEDHSFQPTPELFSWLELRRSLP